MCNTMKLVQSKGPAPRPVAKREQVAVLTVKAFATIHDLLIIHIQEIIDTLHTGGSQGQTVDILASCSPSIFSKFQPSSKIDVGADEVI